MVTPLISICFLQAAQHLYTAPSSVGQDFETGRPRRALSRKGNNAERIGITELSAHPVAYVALQVCT